MVTRWWDEQVLPRAVDLALRDGVSARWRRPVCARAHGTVLEFGFGTGLNLPHYPPEVDRVLAVEPSSTAWQMSAARRERFTGRVELIGDDAAAIDLPDACVDTVVSTWTLCTIPDLAAALTQTRRVLRPGGSMVVVEHTIPDTALGKRLAHAVQPVWGRVAGDCHVDRDLITAIADSGARFEIVPSRFLTGTISWDE